MAKPTEGEKGARGGAGKRGGSALSASSVLKVGDSNHVINIHTCNATEEPQRSANYALLCALLLLPLEQQTYSELDYTAGTALTADRCGA